MKIMVYGNHGQFSHNGGLDLAQRKTRTTDMQQCQHRGRQSTTKERKATGSKHPKHLYREHLTKENSHYLNKHRIGLPPLNSPQNLPRLKCLPKFHFHHFPPSSRRDKRRTKEHSFVTWRALEKHKKKKWSIRQKEKKHIAEAPIGNLFFLRSRKD